MKYIGTPMKFIGLTPSPQPAKGAVTTDRIVLIRSADKLISRINTAPESFSLGQSRLVGITPGFRMGPCQEI